MEKLLSHRRFSKSVTIREEHSLKEGVFEASKNHSLAAAPATRRASVLEDKAPGAGGIGGDPCRSKK